MLEASCKSCPEYKLLHSLILQGLPTDSKDWDACLLPYYRHRHLLTTVGPVVLVNERPVIPKSLRGRIVDHVHAGHPGLSTMCSRLSSTLYWPDYRNDLMKAKLSCPTCLKIAPSNPAMPPRPPATPQYPFQSVVCDFVEDYKHILLVPWSIFSSCKHFTFVGEHSLIELLLFLMEVILY